MKFFVGFWITLQQRKICFWCRLSHVMSHGYLTIHMNPRVWIWSAIQKKQLQWRQKYIFLLAIFPTVFWDAKCIVMSIFYYSLARSERPVGSKSIIFRSTVSCCFITALHHPPYSPDLSPSDFRLFGPLKKGVGGKNVSSDSGATLKWLWTHLINFYEEGILKNPVCWIKCVDNRGSNV